MRRWQTVTPSRSPWLADVVSSVDDSQRYVTRLGASLIATIAPSPSVDEALSEVSARYGLDTASAVLPRGAITVNRADGATIFERAPSGYRLDQTAAVLDLVGASKAGAVTPEEGIRRLDAIDSMPPAVGPVGRFAGIVLIVVGLCLNQDPGLHELIVAGVLSVITATVAVSLSRWGALSLFSATLVAFLTALPVAVLSEIGFLDAPAQVMVPLMSMFTPGAALTIAILEMSMGAMQTGVTRLISGVLQLFLLAFGIILAVSVTPGFDGVDVGGTNPGMPTGVRFAGVILYVLGACLAFSAPRSALRWLAIVILAAWGTQELVGLALHGYASSFIGAVVGVVVAQLVHRYFEGPAALVSLNPIFRILAPGGLTLIGVTSAATQGSVGGSVPADIGSLVFTFIAVALGMGAGLALTHLRDAKGGMRWGLGD
nr:threonine/serine exporter family protein [Gordonia araii]